MHIRPYKNSDYASILAIYHRSKLDELKFEKYSFELLPLEKDEQRYAAFKESEIFVCEEDERGKIIGYGALFASEIRALYVHPDHRGQGSGKHMLAFLLTLIDGPARLFVAKTNVIAKRLYKQYGFMVVDEFATQYNGVPVLANEMKRDP